MWRFEFWTWHPGWKSFPLWILGVLLAGCGARNDSTSDTKAGSGQPMASALTFDPCALVLAQHSGQSRADREIIRLQESIPGARNATALVERLGWAYVAKARESFDPGFYKLAEQCAACLELKQPGNAEALLLRGHVLQNLHRFKEAEPLARRLVAARGLPFDHGLLGDVLMEQGKLAEAIDVYQQMVDLKPDPTAYARIAHVRWLKGDLEGALEMMRDAARGASPLSSEVAAWFHTRLASYEFQAGHEREATRAVAAALEFQKDFPPALLLQGRMLCAKAKFSEAIRLLQQAAEANPTPECQWALADALGAAGRLDEAAAVETELRKIGAVQDARTFALFLATRRDRSGLAVELAERELNERADVHTHDALAWACAAAQRWTDARRHCVKALAEGTADARLFFHAGIIAAAASEPKEAAQWLQRAMDLQQMLLPSEREQLVAARAQANTGAGNASQKGNTGAAGIPVK